MGALAVGRLIDRHPVRLQLWCLLVGIVVVIAYAGRASSGKPPKNYLYTWVAVANGVVEYSVLLVFLASLASASISGAQSLRFVSLRPSGAPG